VDDAAEVLGDTPGHLLPALEEALAEQLLTPAGSFCSSSKTSSAVPSIRNSPSRSGSPARQIGEMLIERPGSAAAAARHLTRGTRPVGATCLMALDEAVDLMADERGEAAAVALAALTLTRTDDVDRFRRAVVAVDTLWSAGRSKEARQLASTSSRQASPRPE